MQAAEKTKAVSQVDPEMFKNKNMYDIQSKDNPRLNQINFYPKDGSDILTIKIIGPGLQMWNTMSNSPIHDEQLKKQGNLLTFGHDHCGYNDIESIAEKTAEYLVGINKINIIIQAHGLPDTDNHTFTLGICFDPEEIMGNPKFISSEILTKQLAQISQQVSETDVISIACYGQQMMSAPSIREFHGATRFCFFSNEDSTWQGDLSKNSNFLHPFYDEFSNITIMETVIYSYAANLREKNFIPTILDKEGNELISLQGKASSLNEALSNPFVTFVTKTYTDEEQVSLTNAINELLNTQHDNISEIPDNKVLGVLIGGNTYDEFFNYECSANGLEPLFSDHS